MKPKQTDMFGSQAKTTLERSGGNLISLFPRSTNLSWEKVFGNPKMREGFEESTTEVTDSQDATSYLRGNMAGETKHKEAPPHPEVLPQINLQAFPNRTIEQVIN